jgi:hypothetical protein
VKDSVFDDVLGVAVKASLNPHWLYLDLSFDSLSQSVGEFDRDSVCRELSFDGDSTSPPVGDMTGESRCAIKRIRERGGRTED